MADSTPENAPEHCPGVGSENAGQADACAGCPNQQICASKQNVGPDPDIGKLKERLSTVKHKLLILSGKGGVGKSTVSTQLSYALSAGDELQVGLLDIDICGPSVPRMTHTEDEDVRQAQSGWQPVWVSDSLCVMSIGYLLSDPKDAVIWRAGKKNEMIKQFIRDVDWGELDVLVIDSPPGTSDEHLSIAQYLKSAGEIDGAVVVTTPQDVAVGDIRKQLNFLRKLQIPVLGIVENMSCYICPCCQKESYVFKATSGLVQKTCADFDVPYLGALPLDPTVVQICERGESAVEKLPDDSVWKKNFSDVVQRIRESASIVPDA